MTPGRGTTPSGATTEQEAALYVREMFGRVAPRYDVANHLLTGNLDRYWRTFTLRRVIAVAQRPGAISMDLCCGTGDLLLALQAATNELVVGADFSGPMLQGASRKLREQGFKATLLEADALQLPLPDASLDLVTCGFGFRNFTNYEAGAREICRVLKPGGVLAILECSEPANPLINALYRLYARRVLPLLGGAVSGQPDAYRYLPDSIRKFPKPVELAQTLRDAGFAKVEYTGLTFGTVTLHLATR